MRKRQIRIEARQNLLPHAAKPAAQNRGCRSLRLLARYGPVKVFDMSAKQRGDLTARLTDYMRWANRDLSERSFNGADFLKDAPAPLRDFFAAYAPPASKREP